MSACVCGTSGLSRLCVPDTMLAEAIVIRAVICMFMCMSVFLHQSQFACLFRLCHKLVCVHVCVFLTCVRLIRVD